MTQKKVVKKPNQGSGKKNKGIKKKNSRVPISGLLSK